MNPKFRLYKVKPSGSNAWIINKRTKQRIVLADCSSRAEDIADALNEAYHLGAQDEWRESNARAQKMMEKYGI